MELKLKDTSCNYFSNSRKAIEYLQNLFENFKLMLKLLDTNLEETEFFRIVDIFYKLDVDKPTMPFEMSSFLHQELTEKRVRKDIFTIRNRLLKDIDFIKIWYIENDREELEARLAVINNYDNILDKNKEAINEISENLKRNRRKK